MASETTKPSKALVAVTKAKAKADAAQADFIAALVAANDGGETLRAIADAASMTNPTVLYHIRKAKAA